MKVDKIYFDMDGVLANFDGGVINLCHIEPLKQGTRSPEEEDLLWNKVREVEHFYYKLEGLPKYKELFDLIYDKYKDRCEILTGIPKEKRGIYSAGEDKIKWVRDYLNKDVKVNICLREEKVNYIKGEGSILIDDYEKNINEWEKNGGTGISFIDVDSTICKLKELNII